MHNGFNHIPRLALLIPAGTIKRYTTLLQAGIFEKSSSTTTVGEFLSSLPGFTSQYISSRIETIFLNGLPVDDLETIINVSSPVLAISGSMPGLAGAIFRKNSFHAPLRTAASSPSPSQTKSAENITIKLKFFNVIASERGEDILNNGCLLTSDSILRFLSYRPQLISDFLSRSCDDKPVGPDDLENILHRSKNVFLRITEDNVST